MPFYVVHTEGEEAERLVKAKSAADAINHCTKGRFSTRTITTIDEAAPLFEAGVKMEKAEGQE
jgi:hypothetical protein